MEKAYEFFDGWLRSQRDFLENWVKTQKEFMENWTESTKKLQEAFFNQVGSQDGHAGKELFELYNSWITSMANSSKVFTDEAAKIQETWKNTVEKQMEMSKEMVRNYSVLFKQTAQKQQ
ncbi:MAG TPA: hypothetical protein DCP92_05355 [Nitrospiraceae bacterium]|jgi:hypothetical protein|nr:hypothetical protein [Nitrospiraceae bacterium]